MGTVYAGVDGKTGREVAIKVLNPGADTIGARRFRREAELAFAVKHPHLCDVLEIGFEAGLPFIVMERLYGETVLDRLKRSGPFAVADAVTIAVQVLQALGAAHATRVIHRDIKPGNVFLLSPPGAPPWSKVIDFGVAKALPDAERTGESSVPITALDVVPGTPPFLAPEQLRADLQLDTRVDVWAVGITLFEMLTARRPFEGRTYVELARRILSDPPAPVSAFRPDVPPALEGVIVRALAKGRADRLVDDRVARTGARRVGADRPRRRGHPPEHEALTMAGTGKLAPTRVSPLDAPTALGPRNLPVGYALGGRYRVVGYLGSGGMGTVYAGIDTRLGRQVAIKVLNAGAKTADAQRFAREAELAFSVKHPHLCDVLDIGVEHDLPFLVMERLHGETVHARMNEGAIGIDEAATIAAQVLQALGAAHGTGVIHRDVKPANVFLVSPPGTEPWAKLIDFGVAKALLKGPATGDAWNPITAPDTVPGTPAYLSPEQVKGRVDLDARVDIWCVGVTLFEMLAGERPFNGKNHGDLGRRILSEAPPRLSLLRADVPVALERVVERALQKDRDARFADAAEMAAALAPFVARPAGGTPHPVLGPATDDDDETTTVARR
jgi:serine/threonine protein kinase